MNEALKQEIFRVLEDERNHGLIRRAYMRLYNSVPVNPKELTQTYNTLIATLFKGGENA